MRGCRCRRRQGAGLRCRQQARCPSQVRLRAAGEFEKIALFLTFSEYGLSWQIVSAVIAELMQDKDPEKTSRVMKAVLEMNKLDIKRLQEAYDQN